MPNLTPPNPVYCGLHAVYFPSVYRTGVEDAQRLMLEALEEADADTVHQNNTENNVFAYRVRKIMEQLRTLRKEPTGGAKTVRA